jgi:prephenate dehydrogenase
LRLAVVGVGLIGGSVALGARERMGVRVSGWDPDPGALASGVVDEVASSLEDAVCDADLVLVATPIEALRPAIGAVLKANERAVVTDAGSVKRGLPEHPRFVGGHPLAGSEHAGAGHARADLFDGAPWFLTRSHEAVEELVRGMGALPHVVDAETHDRWMALTSHLPHVIADVLAEMANAQEEQAASRIHSLRSLPRGPSFRDATRVAGANPPLWRGIREANADFLGEAIEDFTKRLEDRR